MYIYIYTYIHIHMCVYYACKNSNPQGLELNLRLESLDTRCGQSLY